MRTLLWFRGKDLRLSDHAPLADAVEAGEVIPLFVLDPYFFLPRRARQLPHRMQFLLDSLTSLKNNIEAKGSRLILVRGHSIQVVPQVARQWRVDRVVAHRWVEPFGRERDRRIQDALDVPFELYEGETLLPPGSLRSGFGTPYAVYTPFARAHRIEHHSTPPLSAPARLRPIPADVAARPVQGCTEAIPTLAELGLNSNPRLIAGGEREGRQRLKLFLSGAFSGYGPGRDYMDRSATSRLSADLKFGTVSVRTIHSGVQHLPPSPDKDKFLSELLWREFAYSTLWDRPDLLRAPFRSQFSDFPWGFEETVWQAWVNGQTGYPVVDAAARQLLQEGYVHNRARMIAASFLTKHLMIHYQYGEAHYMKYLVDGDWASNNMGWQWSAGCGADAQPYFRVFNPTTQGKKFDPDGTYVRRYVPELGLLPGKDIHDPGAASPSTLAQAGVEIGKSYPKPIVEHAWARKRFLEAAAQSL